MGNRAEKRPMPPKALLESADDAFVPAPDVEAWLRSTFLGMESPLYNVEHDHLNSAKIGVLWSNVSNNRHMKRIAGTAEMPRPQGGKWQKGRALYQLAQWFGEVPDFVITLDAFYAAEADEDSFRALVEHEMYHCAQDVKVIFGIPIPQFTKEGKPKFAIRGHDAEEFVGVVRRYGVGAAASGVAELVSAAQLKPEVAAANVASLCGVRKR